MAKAGMRRPDPKDPHGTESNRKTHFPKNEVAPVPEIQGKAKTHFPKNEVAPVPEIQGKPKPPRKKPNPSPKNKRNEQGKHPARFTYSEIVHFTFAVFFVLVQLTDTFTRYTKSIPRGNR